MIAGTLVLENEMINFTIETGDEGTQEAVVSVCVDGGQRDERVIRSVLPGPMFMKALMLAISWEGEVPDSPAGEQAFWAEAEEACKLMGVRIIP